MNNPLEAINSCIELLDCVSHVQDTESEELQFLQTTKEKLDIYSENSESFRFIEYASCTNSLKAIIDNRNFGLAVVIKNNKTIAYVRFEPSDSLVSFLPNKTIYPLELAELYVVPKERGNKHAKYLLEIVKNIVLNNDNFDSIILSVSEKRNQKYNLLTIYKKLGFNICYLMLDNSSKNRNLPSVVHESNGVPTDRELDGYILISEIY